MRHFIRHYLEMVAAMAAGMVVYGMLFRRGLAWTGYRDEALMALFMTVPMVAWMRYRGHSWRQGAEMAGAMLVPMALVVVAGVELFGGAGRALNMLSHLAMLAGMLVLMLARRSEYSPGGTHGAHGAHERLHAPSPAPPPLPGDLRDRAPRPASSGA